MSVTLRVLTVGSLLLGLAVSVPARDAEKDKTKDDPKGFTHKSLLERLRGLGHEPEFLGKEKTIYRLKVELDGFEAVFRIWVSPDGKHLWIAAPYRLVKVEAIPADVALNLLRLNRDLFPRQLTLDKKNKLLYFQQLLPNQEMSAKELRRLIEDFAAQVKKIDPHVEFPVLQPPSSAPDDDAEAAKLRERIKGQWVIKSRTKDGVTTDGKSYATSVYSFAGKHCRFSWRRPLVGVALEAGKETFGLEFLLDIEDKQSGLAKLEGDELTLCLPAVNTKRPEKFVAEKGDGCVLLVLVRKKS
jgi:hypothetical protein